jgi:hypothetical protein
MHNANDQGSEGYFDKSSIPQSSDHCSLNLIKMVSRLWLDGVSTVTLLSQDARRIQADRLISSRSATLLNRLRTANQLEVEALTCASALKTPAKLLKRSMVGRWTVLSNTSQMSQK